jgi:ribonuclease J
MVPVHGELRHLKSHGLLARECGVPEERILLLKNGQRVSISKSHPAVTTDYAPAGRLTADGFRVASVSDPLYRARRRLSQLGACVVTVILDSETCALLRRPSVLTMGLFSEGEEDLAPAMESAAAALFTASDKRRLAARADDPAYYGEQLRLHLKRWIMQKIGRKTMVYVQVLLMDRDGLYEYEKDL